MSKSRFSILPVGAISDDRITDAQFRTLAALGCYTNREGWCYPSLQTLGKKRNKSFQSVSKDLKHLVKLGYLEKVIRFDENGSRTSNLYHLSYDPPSTSEIEAPSTPEVEGTAVYPVDSPSSTEVEASSIPGDETPSSAEIEPPSIPGVEPPSTSEVEQTSHVNDSINFPKNNVENPLPLNVKVPDRPNFKTMTEEEAEQLPTLKMYKVATQTFPSAEFRSYVHNMITMFHLTADQIRTAYNEWVESGYDPGDCKGIMKVAANGWGKKERKHIEPTLPVRGDGDKKQGAAGNVFREILGPGT
jgi:hypothetical protein